MRRSSQTTLALLTAPPQAELALAAASVAAGLWLVREARAGVLAVSAERAGEGTVLRDGPAGATEADLPLVSILVPARNEASRIGSCIGSLLRLDYPAIEVIVVDDGSTDGTAEVIREAAAGDPRVRVVPAGDVPAGWAGKNHALWRGQALARGVWLLFTDADTVHHPRSLRRAADRARVEGASLLSLTGRQRVVSLPERLVQPFVFEFLARRYPLAAVNDPADVRAAANGQYLLVSRALYDAIGGHEAVKADILEDVALARRAKGRGARILFLATPDLLEVRMYDGARALLEGWTKNLADLAGGTGGALAEGLRLLVRGLLPILALAAAAVAAATDRDGLAVGLCLLGGTGLVALLACAWRLVRLGGGDARAFPWAPIGAAAAGLLFLRSAWRRSGGRQVTWRGRRYRAAGAG